MTTSTFQAMLEKRTGRTPRIRRSNSTRASTDPSSTTRNKSATSRDSSKSYNSIRTGNSKCWFSIELTTTPTMFPFLANPSPKKRPPNGRYCPLALLTPGNSVNLSNIKSKTSVGNKRNSYKQSRLTSTKTN